MIVFWILFVVVFLATAYYAFALLYHWLRYGFLYPMVFVAIPVWGIGTFLLLSLTIAALIAI